MLAVGEEVERDKIESMRSQMEVFKRSLEDFALKHKKEINKNPAFRMYFQRMCTQIGVDTLASRQGFWSQLLGLGDFYYELAVQIVDVCLATRRLNGGLMRMSDLLGRLRRRRPSTAQEIDEDDVVRSIAKLGVLGSGFCVMELPGSGQLVRSVPCELSVDHSTVLAMAHETGFVTKARLSAQLGWTAERCNEAMLVLLREGMAWVDEQAGETEYWFPSLRADLL